MEDPIINPVIVFLIMDRENCTYGEALRMIETARLLNELN